MDTEVKYLETLKDMQDHRSFSVQVVCKRHNATSAVGTIARTMGWVGSAANRKYKWTGPRPITDADFAIFMQNLRSYKTETRKNAPSMQPGMRQKQRDRVEKYQGRRSDLVRPRQFSIFWGLFKWTR